MYSLIFSLLLSAHASEINLGTLGAEGKFKRFGHSYRQSEVKAKSYLVEIGDDRNLKLLNSLNGDSHVTETALQAEKELLEHIYE